LLVGVFDDPAAALRVLLARTGYPGEQSLDSFDYVLEGDAAEGLDAEWLHDTPVAFGAPIGERHAPRRIRQMHRK
jgi:hypothetical protein